MTALSTGSVCAYVAVGSNIEPEKNIPAALNALRAVVPVGAISTFYRTRPLERPEQPDFFNGVWRISTNRAPFELKDRVLRPIEADLGRSRVADPYAARTIDLDLILYGDEVCAEADLVIPDPDIRLRPFVAVPLLEIAPALVLPDDGRDLSSLPVTGDTSGLVALTEFTARLRQVIAGKGQPEDE